MSLETAGNPPWWLITLLAVPVLLSLGILYVWISFSGSNLRVTEILVYAAPLIVTLGLGGLSWWSWITGKRTIAIVTAVITPVLLLISSMFLLGIGI